MAMSKNLTHKPTSTTNRVLSGAVLLMAVAVVGLLLIFGGYYYWDRYVGRLGDQSPLEIEIDRLETAIREDPQNPDNRLALAEFYLAEGLNEQAIEQTRQVLALNPTDEAALLLQGIAYVRLDEPAAALDPLEKFVAARRAHPMAQVDTALEAAYYFLGVCYIQLDRPELAISILEEALTINKTDADALYQLGQAYLAVNQHENALGPYHRAVRLVPDFTEAYDGMISAYTTLNQPDHAAYARGMQDFSARDFDAAQTRLEAATQALPDFAPAFLGLALTYEKQGQLEQAVAAVQHVLTLEPNNFAAQQAHGRIQTTLKQQTQGTN
jgi:tetratricopeptide (TPR) repeat protein